MPCFLAGVSAAEAFALARGIPLVRTTHLMAGGVLCLVGACAIAGIEDAPFHQCLFEAVSAFGTVGVSMGLTPTLEAASRVILIVMMYMGRVGVLTLGVAVFMRRREPPRLKYPDADVFIG